MHGYAVAINLQVGHTEGAPLRAVRQGVTNASGTQPKNGLQIIPAKGSGVSANAAALALKDLGGFC